MTHWGYGLLVAYVALGLGSTSIRKAMSLMVVLTTGVIAYALYSYGAI
jgi:hypothetical protein